MIRWSIAAASCLALAILTLNADPGWPFHGAEASGVQAPAGSACPANAKPANLNFTLKDIDNKDVKLASLKGKVILLDFWATWCGPCKIEMPWFVELQKRYGPQGLQVVGVAMDDASKEDIAKFIKEMGVNYTILLGKESVGDQYGGVPALPETFFIGRDGKIVDKIIGLKGKSEIEDSIKRALNTQAGTTPAATATAAPGPK
jgi:thiol-disulfide isomerase/thioredoxin